MVIPKFDVPAFILLQMFAQLVRSDAGTKWKLTFCHGNADKSWQKVTFHMLYFLSDLVRTRSKRLERLQNYKKIRNLAKNSKEKCKICAYWRFFVPLQRFLIVRYMKYVILSILAFVTFVCMCATMTSCNVTRTMTTESKYFQHGDTTCTIITKTIESYDASKKARWTAQISINLITFYNYGKKS